MTIFALLMGETPSAIHTGACWMLVELFPAGVSKHQMCMHTLLQIMPSDNMLAVHKSFYYSTSCRPNAHMITSILSYYYPPITKQHSMLHGQSRHLHDGFCWLWF